MEHLELLIRRYPELEPLKTDLERACAILEASFAAGGRLYLCGNGGSAADSEHIVGELMKDFCRKRPVPAAFAEKLRALTGSDELAAGLHGALPAVSLCSQTALATALCNDGDPTLVFAQQVYGYGRAGDTLLALSTSGNSANIVKAAQVAKALDLKVISITGQGGGKLAELADAALRLPASETYQVQELTLPVYHALCLVLEDRFFGNENNT